ncbi:hypothetical protein FKM82_029859 [Ascaphus truei]
MVRCFLDFFWNTIILFFSRFTESAQVWLNFSSIASFCWRPCSVGDSRSRSSAYSRDLGHHAVSGGKALLATFLPKKPIRIQ